MRRCDVAGHALREGTGRDGMASVSFVLKIGVCVWKGWKSHEEGEDGETDVHAHPAM